MTSKIPLDVVFVIDATSSSQGVISALRDRCQDLSASISESYGKKANPFYGCVLMRDPVDKPGEDQHEFLNISPTFEPMEIFLGKADQEIIHKYEENVVPPKYLAYGGGDEPEDWAGALSVALERTEWRPESKKMIIMLTDANAHGARFCGYQNHQGQEPLLEQVFVEMANQKIYFVGINIKRRGFAADGINIPEYTGCQKTLEVCRDIYLHNTGNTESDRKRFITEEFFIERKPDGTIELEEFEPDMSEVLISTMTKAASQAIDNSLAGIIMETIDFN